MWCFTLFDSWLLSSILLFLSWAILYWFVWVVLFIPVNNDCTPYSLCVCGIVKAILHWYVWVVLFIPVNNDCTPYSLCVCGIVKAILHWYVWVVLFIPVNNDCTPYSLCVCAYIRGPLDINITNHSRFRFGKICILELHYWQTYCMISTSESIVKAIIHLYVWVVLFVPVNLSCTPFFLCVCGRVKVILHWFVWVMLFVPVNNSCTPYFLCVCVCACVRACVRVCVCVCVWYSESYLALVCLRWGFLSQPTILYSLFPLCVWYSESYPVYVCLSGVFDPVNNSCAAYSLCVWYSERYLALVCLSDVFCPSQQFLYSLFPLCVW